MIHLEKERERDRERERERQRERERERERKREREKERGHNIIYTVHTVVVNGNGKMLKSSYLTTVVTSV